MYLGHAFLAFALTLTIGHFLNIDDRHLPVLGGVAAGYGTLPDVDLWRTIYVYLQSRPTSLFPTQVYVWEHSWVVHRTATHSLIIATITIILIAIYTHTRHHDGWQKAGGDAATIVIAGGLIWHELQAGGTPAGVTMTVFLTGALLLAHFGLQYAVTPWETAGVAAVGLLTHPFGEYWMGNPPPLLYPLSTDPPIGEIFLAADPVVHFLTAITIELALLWTCIILTTQTTPTTIEIQNSISPLAAIGITALAFSSILAIPPPTFAEAYQFTTTLSLLATTTALTIIIPTWPDKASLNRGGLTALATFTIGTITYTLTYLLIT